MRMEGIPERMARYAMESPAQMRLEFGERMGLEDTEHNRVHVEALLNVTYVPNGMSEDELESFLAEGIERAIGNGLLSGDSPAEVDEYEVAFTTVSPAEANLDQEQIAEWVADRIADGNMDLEDLPTQMARYALESPAQMRLEFGERLGLSEEQAPSAPRP